MSIVTYLYKKFFVKSFEQKRKYLIKKGAKIGNNTRIISNPSCFGSEPYLIEIGENCLISSNVNFMTHDGGISVLNNLNYFEKKMDKLGRIKIGNNVFIGMNATIMPGVTIGDNVIVGLGSIVTKNVESNSVVCGVPAKRIESIEEYKNKNMNKVCLATGMTIAEKQEFCESNKL